MTDERSGDVVYLDHNATTPVLPEVLDAMLPYLTSAFGNPSSTHPFGRRAADAVALARGQVAALIGSDPDEIVFTSGGTEANNLAIRGAAGAAGAARRRVVTSAVEHPATVQPLALLQRAGWDVSVVPVTRAGHLDMAALDAAMGPDVALATVMLAQNETGALMPITAVSDAAHRAGAVVHTDAAQAVGKVPVDVNQLGVDLLSIAGHKCYAPKGVGALYMRRGTPVAPVLVGAGQEGGVRPGTENVAGIVGLGAACAILAGELDAGAQRLGALREDLWTRLSAAIPGMVRLTPPPADALPNTLLVAFPGVAGWDLLDAAPGVAAATGSACHSGEHTASAAVLATGLDPGAAAGVVRLSLGRTTGDPDVERGAAALIAAFDVVSR